MFVWSIAYDPRIFALAASAGARCFTYVDEFDSLTLRQGQTMAAMIMVMPADTPPDFQPT